MNNYETLPINRWSVPKFKALSEDAKVLLLYLSVNSDTYSVTSPPLSMEAVAIDLHWKSGRITRRLNELFVHQLIDFNDTYEQLFIKPFFKWCLLDKPCVIHTVITSTPLKPASWRDDVRTKLHGTPLKRPQADAVPADSEPPRIFHKAKLDLDEVDYLYLIENQAPGKTLRQTLSLHCQVAISIAFEILFAKRHGECTGLNACKFDSSRKAVNTHLKVLTPHQDFFCKHFSHTFGRTDDFMAAKMELGQQNYRQLKVVFFNQPELIRAIEAGEITLACAYRQANARHNHPLTNSGQES